MRKALPFAVGVAVSLVFLGFALRHGLEVGAPDFQDGRAPGWQLTATAWGLVGVAVVLGLLAAVWAFRRSRRLEGEGLLFVVPAVLAGLLASGAPSFAATPAEDWAMRHTKVWEDSVREQQAMRDEEKLPPLPVPMHNYPAARADLAALVPTVADLGPGWYDGQRPAVVGPNDGNPGADVRLVKASPVPFGWSFDRTLRASLREYASPAEAAKHLAPVPSAGPAAHYVPLRLSGVEFRVRTLESGSVLAYVQRGARVWTVWILNGDPSAAVLSAPERDAILSVVARRIR